MVAIVSGNGLGLLDSSLVNIGLAGASGQSDKGATVNIATGNLIIQALDETLSGSAADLYHSRTYNAQGTTNDGDGDQWRWNGERRLSINGTLNSSGSSITRTTGDGHEDVYTWNGSAYTSQTGSGAHDKIVLSGNDLVWTEGSTQTIERYNKTTGWINSVRDTSDDGFDFTFTGDKLTKVKDVISGQTFELVYGTSGNGSGKLARLDTRETASGALTRQVYYSYDSSGRLTKVSTDLTPSDNSIADGQVFDTNYTYDGSSMRVSGISQSDGTGVNFTYVSVGGSYRVSTVTDVIGTTTFSYDTANRRTDVTNGEGETWQYFYDVNNQLTKVQSELVDGTRQSAAYTYYNGEVKTITDGLGKTLTYTYDANGNRTREQDSTGHRIDRTYSSANQLLTETSYSSSTTGTPQTTRYVYANNLNLRYVVSAEGRVIENDYSAAGNVIRTTSYTVANYNVSNLSANTALSQSQLSSWADQQDKTKVELTEYSYDYRGNLTKKTEYGTVASNGVGSLGSHDATVTEYVYSAHGQLLQTIKAHGNNYATKTTLSSLVYDGMGRVISSVSSGGVSTTSYGNNVVTVDNTTTGLTVSSVYDTRGKLLNVTASGDGQNRVTQYTYDAAGRVIAVTAPDGGGITRTYYDDAGRVKFERGPKGTTTSYTYDAAGRLLVKTDHWNALNTTTLTVTAHTRDMKYVYTYDNAGRVLTMTEDRYGSVDIVETYEYDYAGRMIKSTLGGDRVTRHFYDKDGLLLGTLNAEGYLSENVYDALGRVTQTIRYGQEVAGTTFSSGTFTQVKAIADNADQISEYYFYDSQGRQVGHIDQANHLTQTVYDERYDRVSQRRHLTTFDPTNTWAQIIERADDYDEYHSTVHYFDAYGRITREQAYSDWANDSNKWYAYDDAGRLVRTIENVELAYSGTYSSLVQAKRLTYNQYNAFSELTGTVSGEGAKNLSETSLSASSVITTAVNDAGVKFDYDLVGRKIAEYGPEGQKTLYYYDTANRMTYTVNALGEVVSYSYRANNDINQIRKYSTRIDVSGLTGGKENSTLTGRLSTDSEDDVQVHHTYHGSDNGLIVQWKRARGDFDFVYYNKYGELYRISDRINTTSWQSGVTLTEETRFSYDKLGRQTEMREYSGTDWDVNYTYYDGFDRITQTKDAELNSTYFSYSADGTTTTTTDALGNTFITSVDELGRVSYVKDGYGKTTSTNYEGNGSLLEVGTRSPEGKHVVRIYNAQNQLLMVEDGEDNVTRYEYNLDGQLVKVIDAEGGVTETVYDKSGRVLETTDANGNELVYTYDAANRVLSQTLDPTGLNVRTDYTYDGKGQQVTVTEAANSTTQARTTEYQYYADGLVKQIIVDPNGLKLSTSYTYDYTGNVLTKSEGTVSDPDQRVTSYEYDRKGRLIKEIVDSASGGLNLTTQYKYDRNDNLTRLIDAGGNSTWYVYNDAGQKSHEINAEGAVIRYDYDKNGKLYHTWAYANTVSTSGYGDIVTSVSVGSNSSSDRRSFNVYSDDGDLTYVLSAVGDGKWRVTKNVYDDNGNVIEIHQYARQLSDSHISQLDSNATDTTTMTVAAVASKMNSASGSWNETRITKYEYDGLNRQVKTILPGWYSTTDGEVYYSSEGLSDRFQRTIEVTYDAVGNQVKNKIRTGLSTYVTEYKSYDAANRLVHSIDGNGHVTKNGYDALGNLTTITRYESASGSPSNGNYWLASESPESGDSRTITNEYDKAGRNTRTIQPASDSYATIDESAPSNNFNPSSYTGSPETIYEYNDLGQVVKQSVKVNDTDWAHSYFYYDAVGRQTWVVDPEKYVTRTTYDGVGNVLTVREYDIPTTDTDLTIDTNASAPSFVGSEYARVWKYEYNQLGQVLVTKRFNAIFTVDQESAATHNNDDVVVSDVTYNAFGEMVENEDVLGNITSYAYNRAGQLTTLTEPVRSVASSGNGFNAATATPITTYSYNAFGDIVSDSRNPNGGEAFTQTNTYVYDHVGNMISRTDAEGHTHTTEYDVAGKVIAEQTIVGSQTVRKEYRYDNVGRQTAALDVFTLGSVEHNAGEQVTYNAFGDIEERHQIFGSYGSESQLIEKYFYTSGGVNYKRESSEGKTYFFYDLTGQLVRQDQRGNEDQSDGTARRVTEWARDLLGRVIVERQPEFDVISNAITSTATSVTTPILKQEYDRWGNVIQSKVFSGDKNGHTGNDNEYYAYHVSEYEYDHNNQVIKETLPETDRLQADGTTDPVRLEKSYHYDQAGNLVRTSDIVLVANNSYQPDPNNAEVVRRYYYNQVGQLTENIDATGVTTEYRYDAHGNQVASRDGVGNVRLDTYNRLGQLTDQGLYRTNVQEITDTHVNYSYTYWSSTTGWYGYWTSGTSTYTSTTYDYQTVDRIKLNHYEYDEAGRRISETVYKDDNNRAGGTISYEYDERGNKTRVTDELGNHRDYTYTSQGYKASETYQLNTSLTNTATWSYNESSDYKVGQMTSSTEAGGRVTTYTYNDFGQIKQEDYSNDGSINATANERTYTYEKNGLLAQVKDERNWADNSGGYSDDIRVSEYGYDIRGNKVLEKVTDDKEWDYWTTYRTYSATYGFAYDSYSHYVGNVESSTETRSRYDEHNRLVEVTSPEVGTNTSGLWNNRAELHYLKYDYDAYGNRRRISASYTKPQTNTASAAETTWYQYDAEGRTLVENGVYNSSTQEIERAQNTSSYGYSYDGAGRLATTEVYTQDAISYYNTRTESYSIYSWWTTWSSTTIGYEAKKQRHEYDDFGREVLIAARTMQYDFNGDAISAGIERTQETKTYDNRGFLIGQTTHSASSGSQLTRAASTYDDKGQLLTQNTYNGSNKLTGITRYYSSGYDAAGNVTNYTYSHYDNGSYKFKYTYTNTYRYVNKGDYQMAKTTVTRSNGGYRPGSSTFQYDNRGNLSEVIISGGESGSKYFIYDNDGKVLAKKETISGKTTYDSYFYQNGNVLGSVGTKGVDLLPDVQHQAGSTPGSYILDGGETLGSIAQSMYGDASLWYLIASENGLSMGPGTQFANGSAGTKLTIPNVDSSLQNTTDNFKPYNPGEIIGDTSPTPAPPPPPSNSCNPIATLIMVVVAVVVTVYTAGALSGATGGFMSTMSQGWAVTTGAAGLSTGTVAAAAAGGFVGSLASQAAGNAMGVVDGYSLRQAAVSGLTAGLSAGVGGAIESGAGVLGKVKDMSNASRIAVQSVASYAGNYAASKMAGLETSFSWQGLAAQVAGSFAGAAVGKVTEGAGRVLSGAASGFAAGVTTAKLSGNSNDINYAQIALDSFGNALANSTVEKIASGSVKDSKDIKTTQQGSQSGSNTSTSKAVPVPIPEVTVEYEIVSQAPETGTSASDAAAFVENNLDPVNDVIDDVSEPEVVLADSRIADARNLVLSGDFDAADPIHLKAAHGRNPGHSTFSSNELANAIGINNKESAYVLDLRGMTSTDALASVIYQTGTHISDATLSSVLVDIDSGTDVLRLENLVAEGIANYEAYLDTHPEVALVERAVQFSMDMAMEYPVASLAGGGNLQLALGYGMTRTGVTARDITAPASLRTEARWQVGLQVAFSASGTLGVATKGLLKAAKGLSKAFSVPNKFKVDSSLIDADIAKGVLVNGNYVKNPTAQNLSSLVTDSGRIGGKNTNGQFMYVIDEQGSIIIGTRGKDALTGQTLHMPHPTLVGGQNPQVLGAGMVDIRAGKIYSVDNVSGHFKPDASSLQTAQKVFQDLLPSNVFHKDFKGFLPFSE